MASRSRFAFDEYGAVPHNPRNAWSYINHADRLVVIGAWAHTRLADKRHVFSTKWVKDVNGRKTASYVPTLRHIEHVIEDDYRLFTFTQYAVPGTENGIPKIESFEERADERFLQVLGGEYYAVPIRAEGTLNSSIEPTDLFEGRAKSVLQTHYERNPHARKTCLEHFGYFCSVCGFDFEAVFGPIGKGYIHVHHVVPVANRKVRYKIDPLRDLIPVCPNCHAMLHQRNPPHTIEELRATILIHQK